ncbi:MAG: hypothetical protein RJA61_495 [Candidatus Parcubacteria bacterium]|jgi:YebC/PmpR family DNA-binding regulatory protein
MSGHNKYSKIKHKKALTDAKKSKMFSKFSRLITLESQKAGGNISSPALDNAIKKAREVNMPNDSIDRAVKKGITDKEDSLEPITYEGYGPGGCALIIDTLSSNRNKTAQEIKHTFSKNGFALAVPGSASWAFNKTLGEGWVPHTHIQISEEDGKILETLIEELEENDDVQEVYTNAE